MIILRREPLTKQEKRNRDTFLRLVGECVTRWAFTDRAIFILFQRALCTDVKTAGVIYYRLTTLSSKLALASAIIEVIATPNNLKLWRKYKKRMEELVPIRNIIVHHPLLAATSGSKGRTRYQYFIRVEPYEVEIGKRTPRAIDVKMLRGHAKQTDKLTHNFAALAPKIFADAKAYSKNLAS